MTSPVSKPKLMTARITKRVDITHDLWQIWVKPETPFGFKPGQYCTIGVDGLERPYSIVSAPYEDETRAVHRAGAASGRTAYARAS